MTMKKVLYPPKWILCIIPPVVFAALIFIFVTKETKSMAAYAVYGMSAYSLVITVAALKSIIIKVKVGIRQSRLFGKVSSTTLGNRYLSDRSFRCSIGIYQGLTANILYMIFRIVTGICYTSVWFISMAIYYMILGFLRGYLIVNYRNLPKQSGAERLAYAYQCYRRTAFLLFLLNVPMGGMIILMVITNSGFSYPGYIIYLSAIYAFYAIITSVINVVKFRKTGNPVLSAARVLNLIAAMMSILALQTAMISQFSKSSEKFRMLMNAITGGIIYAAVIGIAVYMIIHASKMKVKSREKVELIDEQVRKQVF